MHLPEIEAVRQQYAKTKQKREYSQDPRYWLKVRINCFLAVICNGRVTTFYLDTLLSYEVANRMQIKFILPKFRNLTRSVLIISCSTRCPAT